MFIFRDTPMLYYYSMLVPTLSASNSVLVSKYLTGLVPISLAIVVMVFSSSYKNDIYFGFKRDSILYYIKFLIELLLLALTWLIVLTVLLISIVFTYGASSIPSISNVIPIFEKQF